MPESTSERLFWSNFRDTYLSSTAPARIPVLSKPKSEIIAEPEVGRIALRIWTDEPPISIKTPRAIDARYVLIDRRRALEISTTDRSLYRPFFNLILTVCDGLASQQSSAAAALEVALADFRQLLANRRVMSEQEIQGLFGELWTLQQLTAVNGARSITAWTGPLRLSHDFRYGNTELEVKTTSSAAQYHRINGITQLTPSVGCSLYLISIQVQETGPGAGKTVPELVESVEASVMSDARQLAEFRDRLAATGYRKEESDYYNTRWAFREQPKAVFIDKDFPCLTQTKLEQIVGLKHVSRISDIEYALDVSGLGFDCETEQFKRIITI